MADIYPGQRIHLELRRMTFVLYSDGGDQRLELPYSDVDEVIDHLARVTMSVGYMSAETLPANRSATGHLLPDSPRKLRPAGPGKRPKMRFVCSHCSRPIDDRRIAMLSQREFNEPLCPAHYTLARQKLYPDRP